MNLLGKTVVITGAGDGIGREIALRLAKEKVNLALIGRTAEKLEAAAKDALAAGAPQVKSYPVDIRNTPELKAVVDRSIADFGNVDVLINNAGVWQKIGPLESIPEPVIDDVIQTNLTALIHCTQLFLPQLKGRPEAAIINISSRSGVTVPQGQSVYAASKWGVTGFTEVLKADLKGSNIRVAVVHQAGTNTEMFTKTGEEFPVEKYTNPADLAEVVCFMLSRPPKLWLHDVRVEY